MEAGVLEAERFRAVRQLPWWVRWGRGLAAIGRVARDPNRTDQVLEAGLYLNANERLTRKVGEFLRDPWGRRMYEEDWSLDSTAVDYARLSSLPAGTLGHEYASFLKSKNLSPDLFKSGAKMEPAAYIIKRIRQTHDLWHVVTGYHTDVPGEIELQAFTFAQNPNPLSFLIVAVGLFRAFSRVPGLVFRVARAYRRGRRAAVFVLFPWEAYWEDPVDTVRGRLRCA